jgi:hypothetical protein
MSLLLLGGCGQTSAQFDMRLREMAGASERTLVDAMGRIPDNSYQFDDGTKVLQWRWDRFYIIPSAPRHPPRLTHESCIVEWTVTEGASLAYRWRGNACRTVTLGELAG